MADYYSNMSGTGGFPYAERATLVESVKIPICEKFTLKYFDPEFKDDVHSTESGEDSYKDRYYELDFEKAFPMPWDLLPSGIKGKFSVTVLMPSTTEVSDAVDKDTKKPIQTGFKGSKVVTSSYQTSNYITLTIPRYLLYQFLGTNKITVDNQTKTAYATIPKGTEFILVSIGGKNDSTKMRLIGIYTID